MSTLPYGLEWGDLGLSKKCRLNLEFCTLRKCTVRVINTCKSTSGYSHFEEKSAQNVLDVRVTSHMVENETIRILEFITGSQLFQKNSGVLFLIAELLPHYTLQFFLLEQVLLRCVIPEWCVRVADCSLVFVHLGVAISLRLLQRLWLILLRRTLLFEQLVQVLVDLLAIRVFVPEVILKSNLVVDFVGNPWRVLHQLWLLRQHLVLPTCLIWYLYSSFSAASLFQYFV